jgi:FkbM family methyltransferase
MYDGTDTAYYLECGYRVIAVEANPDLVRHATERFRDQIASGQLTCINAAISPNGQAVDLVLSAADLRSSTVFKERLANARPIGSIRVPGLALSELFERYGVPYFLKVDIERADRFCVLSLKPGACPRYLSFELGDDVDELTEHTEEVGFKHFKIVNQNWHRELANQLCLYDRVTRRLMWYLGFAEPRLIRRVRHFSAAGFCSGPPPWQSDGRWYSSEETRARLQQAKQSKALSGWYDIHATLD